MMSFKKGEETFPVVPTVDVYGPVFDAEFSIGVVAAIASSRSVVNIDPVMSHKDELVKAHLAAEGIINRLTALLKLERR